MSKRISSQSKKTQLEPYGSGSKEHLAHFLSENAGVLITLLGSEPVWAIPGGIFERTFQKLTV